MIWLTYILQALASLKQKVKKYNKEFEEPIKHCRENPELYEEEEEEVEEDELDQSILKYTEIY